MFIDPAQTALIVIDLQQRLAPAMSDFEPCAKNAELIINGKSDKEIASILNISTGTVAVHNKNIYKKLDVHSRSQLIEKVQ